MDIVTGLGWLDSVYKQHDAASSNIFCSSRNGSQPGGLFCASLDTSFFLCQQFFFVFFLFCLQNAPLSTLVARLWPFFRHSLATVRQSVLETFFKLVTSSSEVISAVGTFKLSILFLFFSRAHGCFRCCQLPFGSFFKIFWLKNDQNWLCYHNRWSELLILQKLRYLIRWCHKL